MRVWRSCWDERVVLMGAVKAVLVELRKTETDPTETLRGNGYGSKVCSLYLSGNALSQDWLRATLQPYALGQAGGGPVEEGASHLLDDLIAAMPRFPRSVKFMAFSVDRETQGKATHGVALTSFLVLRFLLPALMAPAAYGVIDRGVTLSKEAQTRLTGLARHVQQVANGKVRRWDAKSSCH